MDPQVDLHEDRRSRAAAAAEIVASTLERGVPHLALAAAREAARSALLELGRGPRRLAARDSRSCRNWPPLRRSTWPAAPPNGRRCSGPRCRSWTACSFSLQERGGAPRRRAAMRDNHRPESRITRIRSRADPGEASGRPHQIW